MNEKKTGKSIKALTGNEAAAYAMKQIDPDVVAAYPITPATEIVQIFSDYVSNGKVSTEMILVESEHSAMSACIGASAAGARVMTGTSSCGLALMWEVLYVAASTRCPIVMCDVNRALSGPINIHCDHSDTMGARDSGWIQIYSENTQEAYDNLIQAVKVAEDPSVRLPTMVMFDGFIISHSMEGIEIASDETVKSFVGPFKPVRWLLDTDKPYTFGPLDLQDYCFEHKKTQSEALKAAKPALLKVSAEFEKTFGRKYGLFETYKLEDAEIGIVLIGSTAGTAKDIIDELRAKGKKVGLLKIRLFRPFPAEEIRDALKHLKVVGVLDRYESFSDAGGALYQETRSALYDLTVRPKIHGITYGIGGRDITLNDINQIFQTLEDAKTGKELPPVSYLGVRE
ncbi:MAG: pyruvate ferredoxin oxidoreductase [Candidatus Riflebacteria bacterium]|nr:pyruvate ferredoxin oxidoreductase [Candidatus Riflebacteria bacterium]